MPVRIRYYAPPRPRFQLYRAWARLVAQIAGRFVRGVEPLDLGYPPPAFFYLAPGVKPSIVPPVLPLEGGSKRGVAQPGRALGSGPRSRWFKSSRPDFSLSAPAPVAGSPSRLAERGLAPKRGGKSSRPDFSLSAPAPVAGSPSRLAGRGLAPKRGGKSSRPDHFDGQRPPLHAQRFSFAIKTVVLLGRGTHLL